MRAHISLNVKDVKKSVEFYGKLFGAAPQKQTSDYAKFDLKKPALNFSMQSGSAEKLSRVSHLGIEVDSPSEIKEWKERMERAGIAGKTEEDTTCCFARQDKVWFKDPDGNSWEIFHVYEQLPVLGSFSTAGSCCAPSESGACCAS
jgi:catechol 2,3-dioxygenase-like lactoylglutathione lyase family enzyme